MPKLLKVDQLIDRGKKRSDKENDDQLSASEWQQNLNTLYGEIYEMVAESGMRYFEKTVTIVADGSASYMLPSDHLSTIAIDGEASPGGRRFELDEEMIQDRNHFSGVAGANAARKWALVGADLKLSPIPSSGSYYHTYVRQAPDLIIAQGSDEIDVFTSAGEAFLTWGLSVLAKAKEESDVRLDIGEREAAKTRLQKWVLKRSLITPRRVRTGEENSQEHLDPGGWR